MHASYKSIRAMAYCDATFGPILMRSTVLEKIETLGLNLLNFTIADRLVLFTANPDLRVIHCPDCMFYTKSRPKLTKDCLLKAARRLEVGAREYLKRNKSNFNLQIPMKNLDVFSNKLKIKVRFGSQTRSQNFK